MDVHAGDGVEGDPQPREDRLEGRPDLKDVDEIEDDDDRDRDADQPGENAFHERGS
jgi:hypothetical protein